MPHPTHAGAIAFRETDGTPHLLLVTAKRHRDRWIFPKGKIKSGESLAEAAVRELEEEGGVRGEGLEHVSTIRLGTRKGDPVVAYHLVRFIEDVGSDEPRRRRWCTLDEAAALLSFADARRVLRKVAPLVAPRGGGRKRR